MRKGALVVAAGGLGGDQGVVRALAGLGIEGGSPSDYTLSYLRLPEGRSRDILVRGRYASHAAGRGLPAGGARGEVIDPICETGPKLFFHNNLPAPFSGSGVPSIFEVPVGKGAFVLLPQPVFRHYAKEPSLPLREVIGRLVSRRLPPPRIGLRIPRKLDFSIVEGPDALYVHLLNPSIEPSLCCGPMDIYEGKFERSYEYMEEEVPVHDLRILVRRDRIGDVSTLREKSPVETRRTADGWEILVKRVSLWEIVKIGLGPGGWREGGAWSWR